jgi:hypothetical protein
MSWHRYGMDTARKTSGFGIEQGVFKTFQGAGRFAFLNPGVSVRSTPRLFSGIPAGWRP